MSYTNRLLRGTNPSFTSGTNGLNPLIPLDVSREIIKSATQKSAALTMFKKRPMSTAQQRMPVLSTKPTAYFVNGDTGMKQTTNVSWENKFLDAEEIAVIVPIPEKLLDDIDYDIWGEIKPEIEEAIGVALDLAIFFGINKPSSWPTAIAAAAIAAGNTVTHGTSAVDVAEDLNQVMAAVEGDGFDVNGFWMRNSMKSVFRGLRSTTKEFIFLPNEAGLTDTVFKGSLYGEKAVASMSGVFETADTDATYGVEAQGANGVELIAGDWSQGIIGVRQDITYKLLDQAVLQNASGDIVYNLPQQDMVAMRVVCRFAFQVPNPLNRINTNSSTRYPFAVLRAAA